MVMKRKYLLSASILIFAFFAHTFAQKTQILALSKKIIIALKNKDMKTFSTFVHPIKGVRFSPYSYVDKDSDLVFKKAKIPALFSLRRKYNWGEYDGSGYPIN